MDLRQQERLKVVDADGEKREVLNKFTVVREADIKVAKPSGDFRQDTSVYDPDNRSQPEVVTHWVAKIIESEYQLNVKHSGIDVIDPTDEEVTVI